MAFSAQMVCSSWFGLATKAYNHKFEDKSMCLSLCLHDAGHIVKYDLL